MRKGWLIAILTLVLIATLFYSLSSSKVAAPSTSESVSSQASDRLHEESSGPAGRENSSSKQNENSREMSHPLEYLEGEAQAGRSYQKDAKAPWNLYRDRLPASSTAEGSAQATHQDFTGAYSFQAKRGFWLQAGASVVSQQIRGSSQSLAPDTNAQMAARSMAGFWWRNIVFQGQWRESFASGASVYKPRWLQANVGVGLNLPSFWGVQPDVALTLGWESYKNQSKNSAYFIRDYQAPIFGFRSRFALSKRWEIGGDAHYMYLENTKKLFLQGDLRYWFSNSWAFGAGYWYDDARVKASDNFKFDERSYALETYLRWVYE